MGLYRAKQISLEHATKKTLAGVSADSQTTPPPLGVSMLTDSMVFLAPFPKSCRFIEREVVQSLVFQSSKFIEHVVVPSPMTISVIFINEEVVPSLITEYNIFIKQEVVTSFMTYQINF